MKQGRISLTLIATTLLMVVVVALAYLLMNQTIKPPSLIHKKEEAKPQQLQVLINQAAAKSPKDASWIIILYNKEMNMYYVPGEDSYVVKILNPQKESSVKDGTQKYFKELGVADPSALKITYLIPPQI